MCDLRYSGPLATKSHIPWCGIQILGMGKNNE